MTHEKKLVSLSTVLMLVVCAAGTSLAAVPDAAKSKPAEVRTKEHAVVQTVYGTVSAVKPATKTVEVTVPWGKADGLIEGATVTQIQEGKIEKSLANLKVGEHLRMKFVEHLRSRNIAKPIIIPLEHHRG